MLVLSVAPLAHACSYAVRSQRAAASLMDAYTRSTACASEAKKKPTPVSVEMCCGTPTHSGPFHCAAAGVSAAAMPNPAKPSARLIDYIVKLAGRACNSRVPDT
jgi:hypothetical protein